MEIVIFYPRSAGTLYFVFYYISLQGKTIFLINNNKLRPYLAAWAQNYNASFKFRATLVKY